MLTNAILFWFALLVTAVVNAVLREKVLKPWLEPAIGKWAHQLSVFTAFGLMLALTVLFLSLQRAPYTDADLWRIGFLWCGMTVLFEFAFGRSRGLSWDNLFGMYRFWTGELWSLLVLSMLIMPLLADRILK
ncbi:MAG: hypothetical protein IPK53_00870 [bacterium]|nr:hypothetical protein [bacterium]MBK8127516.1 hypothetical protein [bacterium]